MFGDDCGLITCQNFWAFLVTIRCKYISGRSYMHVLAGEWLSWRHVPLLSIVPMG